MKKTLAFALCLSMVSVASAATKKKASRPATPAVATAPCLPMTEHRNSFSVYYDHTTLDAGAGDDGKYPGIRIAYDRSFGQWKYGYCSFHASLAYGGAEEDGVDETLYGALLGVDGNLKLNDKIYVYAGPRLGLSEFEQEGGIGGDVSESLYTYGIEFGVRYFVNDRWNVQASYRFQKYQEKDDMELTSSSLSIGAGWAF